MSISKETEKWRKLSRWKIVYGCIDQSIILNVKKVRRDVRESLSRIYFPQRLQGCHLDWLVRSRGTIGGVLVGQRGARRRGGLTGEFWKIQGRHVDRKQLLTSNIHSATILRMSGEMSLCTHSK